MSVGTPAGPARARGRAVPEVGREGLVCGEGVGGKGDRASVVMDKEHFKIGEGVDIPRRGTYQRQYFENPGAGSGNGVIPLDRLTTHGSDVPSTRALGGCQPRLVCRLSGVAQSSGGQLSRGRYIGATRRSQPGIQGWAGGSWVLQPEERSWDRTGSRNVRQGEGD